MSDDLWIPVPIKGGTLPYPHLPVVILMDGSGVGMTRVYLPGYTPTGAVYGESNMLTVVDLEELDPIQFWGVEHNSVFVARIGEAKPEWLAFLKIDGPVAYRIDTGQGYQIPADWPVYTHHMTLEWLLRPTGPEQVWLGPEQRWQEWEN